MQKLKEAELHWFLVFLFLQKCFFRQFFHSVAKVDYLTLRHGFISVSISFLVYFIFFNLYIHNKKILIGQILCTDKITTVYLCRFHNKSTIINNNNATNASIISKTLIYKRTKFVLNILLQKLITFSQILQAHLSTNTSFNFQKYIERSLEDDFKVVVGIRFVYVYIILQFH